MIHDSRKDQMAHILLSYKRKDLDRIIADGNRNAEGKILIYRFRRELGYSSKTVNVDIWNSIEMAYKALEENQKRTFHFKSKTGVDMRELPKTVRIVREPQHPYCQELGCTEKGHHPECALNPCEKKNNNWDRYNAHPTKESAQQRLENIWRDHKWSIAIGIQIIVAAILKYRGIL